MSGIVVWLTSTGSPPSGGQYRNGVRTSKHASPTCSSVKWAGLVPSVAVNGVVSPRQSNSVRSGVGVAGGSVSASGRASA